MAENNLYDYNSYITERRTLQQFSDSELILIKTNIAGWFFDGFMEVTHDLSTTVTSHQVQKGASMSDHAYINPVEVSMTIRMSDTMKSISKNQESQYAGISYTRSTAAYRILEQLQRSRTPFQVHTRLLTYKNMIITNLSVQDDIETLYGLECKVTMQELIVASEKKVTISSRTQTTTTSNSGKTDVSDYSNNTALLNLSNFISQSLGV